MAQFRELHGTHQPGNYLRWDVPKSVEGVFLGFAEGRPFAGKTEPSKLIALTINGAKHLAPATTDLAEKLAQAPAGSDVRITYHGTRQTTRGNTIKEFTVECDEGNF